MARTTNHSRDGRFCSADTAKVVVKDGERFHVVRQLRRAKPKKKKGLPSSKWMPVSEVLAGLGVRPKLETRTPRMARPQKCKFCDSPATKAFIWAEGRAYVPVCGDKHLAKAKETTGEKGVGTRPIPVE